MTAPAEPLKRTEAHKVLKGVMKDSEKRKNNMPTTTRVGSRKEDPGYQSDDLNDSEWRHFFNPTRLFRENKIDLNDEIQMREGPLYQKAVRDEYKKYLPTILNPMSTMGEERNKSDAVAILSETERAATEAATKAGTPPPAPFTDEQKQFASGYVDFLKRDVTGFSDVTKKINTQLNNARDVGKQSPVLLPQGMERVFYSAHVALRTQQRKEVKAYVASLDPNQRANFDAQYSLDFARLSSKQKKQAQTLLGKESTFDLNTADESQKGKVMQGLREEKAAELLKPIHDAEYNALDKQIDRSRQNFQKKHESLVQWSDILSRQTPALLAAAEEQRKIRYEDAKKEYEKKKNADGQLFDPNAAAGVTGIPDGFYDEFHEDNDENGSPTLADIRAAIKVDEKKSPRKLGGEDVFRYAAPGTLKSGLGGIRHHITLEPNGGISCKNLPDSPQELSDVMNFMARTIMQDAIQSGGSKSIEWHFDSVEACKAAYKAARIQGFKKDAITFDTSKPEYKSLTEAQMAEIDKEVAKFEHHIAKREELSVAEAIAKLPQLNVKTLDASLQNKTTTVDRVKGIIEDIGRRQTLLSTIEQKASEYRAFLVQEQKRPLTPQEEIDKKGVREALNKAVTQLNDQFMTATKDDNYFIPPQKVSAKTNMTLKDVDNIIKAANAANIICSDDINEANKSINKAVPERPLGLSK